MQKLSTIFVHLSTLRQGIVDRLGITACNEMTPVISSVLLYAIGRATTATGTDVRTFPRLPLHRFGSWLNRNHTHINHSLIGHVNRNFPSRAGKRNVECLPS